MCWVKENSCTFIGVSGVQTFQVNPLHYIICNKNNIQLIKDEVNIIS
jgi:hypothetical protein